MFYFNEKHAIIEYQNHVLKTQSTSLIFEFKTLHTSGKKKLLFPKHKEFKTAVYDIDSHYLYGDFHPKSFDKNKEFSLEDSKIIYVQHLFPYYLGIAYIVTQKPLDTTPVQNLQMKLIVAFCIAIVLISLIAYLLGHLFLSPMRHSIKLLDEFIKDATHELNTPVSTILANAELLKNFYPELKDAKELSRIEIASKRLSRIYDDLAYVKLNHQRHKTIEPTNVSLFLKERIDYFKVVADTKHIDFKHIIAKDIILEIDKEDIARIIDNLLGNAFKYTPANGSVKVTLNEHLIAIEDTGIGIDEDAKTKVLQRFVRANKSEGGFGLGLSIVADIASYYNYKIEIQSKLSQGTKVSILWQK